MVAHYQHCYSVKTCPSCNQDLTVPGHVVLVASVNEALHSFPTRLDQTGLLVDVDQLIENGYHSDTECSCGERLTDYEID